VGNPTSPHQNEGYEDFSLSREDKNDWNCESRRQLANLGLPGKWPLKWCVTFIVCVTFMSDVYVTFVSSYTLFKTSACLHQNNF